MPDKWLAAACAFGLSLVATWMLAGFLRRRAIVARPNERSLHTVPTPQGGGLAIFAALAVCSPFLSGSALWTGQGYLLGLTLGLLLLSQFDDLFDLPAGIRFAAQIVAVAFCPLLHGELVFQGWLPPLADHVLAKIVWLWFINLFNFMDGMDGLAGGEAAAISLGLFLLPSSDPSLLVLAAALAGFLVWNWNPARIFLGDAGSVPLGFLLGGLLLRLAGQGHWIEALLLPLYFLADASITLGLRLLRREKIWQAHRQHFYQRAFSGGASHRRVATVVLVVNVLLVLLAVYVTPRAPWAALAGGIVAIISLLAWMHRRARLVA